MSIIHDQSTSANKKTPFFYVPTAFNWQKHFSENEWQQAAYFYNLVRWKWLNWQADEQGYVHLQQRYLRRVIDQDLLPKVIDVFNGCAVVIASRFWTPGVESIGYKIAPQFREATKMDCTDPKLIKRIHRIYGENSRNFIPVHKWLDGWLRQLSIDTDIASQIIPGMKPKTKRERTQQISIEEFQDMMRETVKTLSDSQAHIDSVDRFGRVHTPITRLSKQLRRCLRLSGESLVGLDIANSQPLILGLVASQMQTKRSAQTIKERVFVDGKNAYHRRFPSAVENVDDDLKDYLELCQQGQLYESFMDENDDRDQLKQEFFTAVYSENKNRVPLKTILKNRYPTIHVMLRQLKKKDYRHAAHLMQNIESTIMFSGICKEIMIERPDTPVVTIHDSILTTPENVEYVQSKMMAVYGQIRIKPTICIDMTQAYTTSLLRWEKSRKAWIINDLKKLHSVPYNKGNLISRVEEIHKQAIDKLNESRQAVEQLLMICPDWTANQLLENEYSHLIDSLTEYGLHQMGVKPSLTNAEWVYNERCIDALDWFLVDKKSLNKILLKNCRRSDSINADVVHNSSQQGNVSMIRDNFDASPSPVKDSRITTPVGSLYLRFVH